MGAPEHLRLTYSGVFGAVSSPIEQWSMGLSIAPGTAGFIVKADLETIIQPLADAWLTAWQSKVSGAATLTRARLSLVDVNGKTPRDGAGAFIQAERTMNVGGLGSTAVPYQMALAVTMQSAAAGATGRGRFYIPAPVLGSLANGVMTTATQDGFLASGKSFLDSLNATLAGSTRGFGRVTVASAGSPAKGIQPALRTVTSVSVGIRPDVQRRRAADLPENRKTSQLA